MDTQKIIDSINIIRAIQNDPTCISDVEAKCSASRSTIHRFLADAESWKLVASSTTNYTTTAAGDLVLRKYNSFEDSTQTQMSFLAGLEHGFELLEVLADSPAIGKAEIARRSGVSRATVQRTFKKFASGDHDLIVEQGRHEVTDCGKRVLGAYTSFDEVIETIESKIEFLERYEGPILPPIEALAESRMVESTVTDNQEVVREIKKIDVEDTETFHAMSQAFSGDLSDNYRSEMSRETSCELIVDRTVYEAITHPKRWRYLFEGLKWPEFDLLVFPDEVMIGIGLYDDEYAVIAAYNEQHPFHVGLFGSHNTLIEWVENVYEMHREQAVSPRKDLFKWAKVP